MAAMHSVRIAAVVSMMLAMGLTGCSATPPVNPAEDQVRPLRRAQMPPVRVPQVTANGAVVTVAQYSWGSGTDRRVSSPSPPAVPITDVPANGETIVFALATAVRPSLMSISAFSQLEPDGTPSLSHETPFDCEKPEVCDISEDGNSVSIRVTVPETQMVTLRTAFDVPSKNSGTGLDEPFTASWVVRLIR